MNSNIIVSDLHQLNLTKPVEELRLGVREAIWRDADGKMAFLKCSVTSSYWVASKYFGSGSVQKLIDEGKWKIIRLEKLRIGRWVFHHGDLKKADRFRSLYNIPLVGPRATASYDLRGEVVR